MQKKIPWINAVKAICMLSVYMLHSEAYYGIGDISYGQVLQPFYVNGFFFISGYLFFGKQLRTVDSYDFLMFWKNIKNVVFRLIIPTIVFASAIYIPKLFFHNMNISVGQYFHDVFGGISFWFTSAITVSQIILLCLLFIKSKNVWTYFVVSVFLFVIAIYLGQVNENPFPWYYKSGLGATLFLTLGGVYNQYESKIDGKFGRMAFCLIALLYLVCVIYNFIDPSFQYAIMSMTFNFSGLFVSVLGIIFILLICKRLPDIKILEFIGRNSIVFYFFSGAVPASVGLLFQKIFPDKLYIITMAVALISICIGYILTYIIVNYFPWLTDFRKLRK